MSKLSQRLQAVLDTAIPGEVFWDFCCDHGQLGEAALASGQFSQIYFVDQVEHIMAALKERISHEPQTQAVFYLCPGEEIAVPVYGTMTIAGVGGNTVVKILRSLADRDHLQAKRIVINPATRRSVVEEFLQDWQQSYTLSETKIFEENKIERFVYILDRIAE